MSHYDIVSRHFLRRRARKRMLAERDGNPGGHYGVERAKRGPFRWYVVQYATVLNEKR